MNSRMSHRPVGDDGELRYQFALDSLLAISTPLARSTLTELVGGFSCDLKLPHLGDQSCSEQTESRRRAIASTHDPVGFAKDRDDVRSLGIHQRARAWNRASCVYELRHGCL